MLTMEEKMNDLQSEELRRRLITAYERDWHGTHHRVVRLAERLRSQYPDWQQYRYYHVLIGSTPRHHHDFDDFPNGEVAGFLSLL